MVPPTATMDSYLLVMVHFFMSLRQIAEIPKIVTMRAMTTMANSNPRKEKEMVSLRK
jgi:hypothetical protein